jgi:flagellar capping protein FliD
MSSSSSGAGSTNSLFTPLQFTGISKYSNDFQTILSRATSIASLPVLAMQNRLSDVTEQETDLTSLGVAASAVGSALQVLGNLSSGGAQTANSSDTDVVTATNVGAAAGTSYNITNVTSIASAASEISAGFSDSTSAQVSKTGTIELINGSYSKTITLTAGQNNLKGIAAAINALTGSGVTASVLTTGGTNGYYLSITANSTGETTLKLKDSSTPATQTDLLSSTNQGSNTKFDLNGAPVSKSV